MRQAIGTISRYRIILSYDLFVKAAYYDGNRTFSVRAGRAEIPADGEVRLDVAYCGICGTDLHIAHGAMDGRVRPPQVIGHEMSGIVGEVGAGVEGFRPGDPVVVRPLDARAETPADKGYSHVSRGLRFLGIDTPGAFQSSWTVPAFTLHHVPASLDLRLAALVEPLAVACHDVRRAELQPGQTCLVIGAGPIGLLVALASRERGARVLVNEINPGRLAFAAELGLETVAPAGDLAAAIDELTQGVGAEVVFEVSGAPAAVLAMTQAASVRGRIVVVAIHPDPQPVRLFDLFWKELEVRGARVYEPEDYERAIEIVSSGSLPLERLISRVEPLDRLPEVFEELSAGTSDIKVLVDCRA
jgi:(R,R)-butanediol dehydrogenase / meso-butanediol dehydrogenase / diacetyl reductase